MGMKKKRKTKKFGDVVIVSVRRDARTHGVRQRAKNYVASKKRNVTIAETYCGREHIWGKTKMVGAVDCISCIQAIDAR